MFRVVKELHFCYGHRLMNYEGACCHPHGHNGKVEIEIESNKLDQRGMVMDFNTIKTVLQNWINESLDHKMLLRKDDPLVGYLKKLNEPFFLMKENPTAESIAKLIYDYGLSQKLPIKKVTLWETPSSSATYSS